MTPEDPQISSTEAALDAAEPAGDGPVSPEFQTAETPETGDERADRLQIELDDLRAGTPDPMDRHPGSVTGLDEPQDETLEARRGDSDEQAAVRKFVEEWDGANLDERNILLAGLAQSGGHDFVEAFRNGSEDYRSESLRSLRRGLGIEDDDS